MDDRNNLEPDQDQECDEEDGGQCFVPLDLQCILYSDFNQVKRDGNNSWTSKPVAEQYEACRAVLNHPANMAIPLKVLLYPLQELMPNIEGKTKIPRNLRDVSLKIVLRCQIIWNHLQRIRCDTDDLIGDLCGCHCIPLTTYKRIKEFGELITKYVGVLGKALAEWTIDVRRGEIMEGEEIMAKMIKAMETQSPFLPNELNCWLDRQKQQIKTFKMLDQLPDVRLVSAVENFKKEVTNGTSKASSYAVVIHLPNLDGMLSDSLVDEMKRYVEVFNQTPSSNWTGWKSDSIKEQLAIKQRDSISTSNCRRILVAAQEFSTWVTNNNSDNSNVRYIIFYDEQIGAGVGEISPLTRLYDCRTGDALPLNFTIPKVPSPVTVEKNYRGVITLSWTTEEEIEEPSNFLLQYRSIIDRSGERWDSIQHHSKEITISHLQSKETYVFRVATVTPGGRSPFSPVSCEVTIDPVCPPPSGLLCRYVTNTSITISWSHPFNSGRVETVAEEDEDNYAKDEDEYDDDCYDQYDPHDDDDNYDDDNNYDDNYDDEYYDNYDDDENRHYSENQEAGRVAEEEDDYKKDEDEYDDDYYDYYDPRDDHENYDDEYYYYANYDDDNNYDDGDKYDGEYYDENRHYRENQEAEVTITSYYIDCWMGDSRHQSTFIQRSTTEKTITLEPLVPDTDYYVQVRAICTDATGSTFYSPASQIIEAKTLRDAERAAHIVRHVSKKCSVTKGVDLYQLPLKRQRGVQTQGVGHYVFGEPSYLALAGKRRQRTILVLGATGSGKSTLIDAMVNYMLGVEWNDDFRFKLIDEPADKSQAHSQTDLVTTCTSTSTSTHLHDLHEMKDSRLNYSLTVLVDTPGFGDTRGLEKDKKIMQQIQDYFQCRHGIQQLEAVCFVVQSSLSRLTATQQYIFDSILSIFGQDIKDNIRLMVTFADGALPPVLGAVKEAGIPSPWIHPPVFLFTTNLIIPFSLLRNKGDRQTNEFNRTYFDMAVEGFDKFFDDLSRMEAKSLTLTREVFEERKRLEALVEGLQLRTQIKLARIDEFEQIKKILTDNHEQIDANKNFEFDVEFLVPEETDISGTGQFTTNCQKCRTTCHFPCGRAHDEDKHLCSVMDSNGSCRICKCPWNEHFNQKYTGTKW
jgi:GTP-binding protein EngB required for normal cell division